MQAKLQSKITLFLIKPIYELSETMDIRGPKWALKKKIAARKHATPLGAKPPLSLNPRNAPAMTEWGTPSKAARNLGVIIDEQLTYTDRIASVSRSCSFAQFNICKIKPYLNQYATQLLVQTLVSSRLDYCNALLT